MNSLELHFITSVRIMNFKLRLAFLGFPASTVFTLFVCRRKIFEVFNNFNRAAEPSFVLLCS